jgi:hypothetical protein
MDENPIEPLLARFEPPWPAQVDCGPGWHPLLGALDAQLSLLDPGYRLEQVKEKLGGLRYYAVPTAGDLALKRRFNELIREAEQKAALTCELCAAPGQLCRNRAPFATYKTLCGACAERDGASPIA